MSTSIVVPDCDDSPIVARAFAAHQVAGVPLIVHTSRPSDDAALIERIRDATTVVPFFTGRPLSASVLHAAASLQRVIVAGPVGTSVDLLAARARNVEVHEAPGLAAAAVAEFSVGLMFALARRLVDSASRLSRGEWAPSYGVELGGKVVGVVGLGRVGERVARLCKALGMEVLAWSPSEREQVADACGARLVPLDELLAAADFVTLHLRLGPATSDILDRRRISTMRRSAFLVNTARAGLVDNAALVEALRARVIAGAALDVFENEPLSLDDERTRFDNVILTPHVAWMTAEAAGRFVDAAVDHAVHGNSARTRRVI